MNIQTIYRRLPLRLLLLGWAFVITAVLYNPIYGEPASQVTFYVR